MEPEVVITQAALLAEGRPADVHPGGLGGRFGRYLAGVTLSFYGDWLSTVALVVLLYRLSGPAAPAGYMLARVVPRVLSGTYGGGLADRYRPQHVVAACAVIQGAFTASIVPSAHSGAIWAVYSAVALGQFAGGMGRPAAGALVPRVAPAHRLQRANAVYSVAFSSSIAVGPAIAAPLLAAFGAYALLLIDTATFAVAAVLMMTLGIRGRVAWQPGPRGATIGLRAVWRDSVLRALAAGYIASAIAVTATSAVLVLISTAYGSTDDVGYLYAAVGGGAVILGIVVLRVRPAMVSRELIVGYSIVEVLCLGILAIHLPLWLVFVALAGSAGAGVVWQTWGTTDMQMRSNPAFLGRVNAVMVTAASAGMVPGAALALLLVPWLGWQHTLFIACCVSLAVLAAGVVLGPQRAGEAEGR